MIIMEIASVIIMYIGYISVYISVYISLCISVNSAYVSG